MKQSEVPMYIESVFRSSHVIPLQKCDDAVNEKNLNHESKMWNPISSKEKGIKIANICSKSYLEYS